MKTLKEIYPNYSSDEGHGDKGTAHSYIEEYERLLGPYRTGSTVLEIGLCYGESLRMWNEYFIDSTIIGVDIEPTRLHNLIGKYNILIADATQHSFLNLIVDHQFDVIIDDGSHRLEDQLATFSMLKNKIKPGGIYIIEDINDINVSRSIFETLQANVEIIDNRHIKGRGDDVLVVYRF